MAISKSAPTVYFIRHGEKPTPENTDDAILDERAPHWRQSCDNIIQARITACKSLTYLAPRGEARAKALVEVFGHGSPYNIGYIIAQTPDDIDASERPTLTVTPLAEHLGLIGTRDFNTDITVDDFNGVVNTIHGYTGKGNILVCWEHKRLMKIAEALGIQNLLHYPGERFDLIYTVQPSHIDKTTGKATYDRIDSITSQGCEGLDEAAFGKVLDKDTGKPTNPPDVWKCYWFGPKKEGGDYEVFDLSKHSESDHDT